MSLLKSLAASILKHLEGASKGQSAVSVYCIFKKKAADWSVTGDFGVGLGPAYRGHAYNYLRLRVGTPTTTSTLHTAPVKPFRIDLRATAESSLVKSMSEGEYRRPHSSHDWEDRRCRTSSHPSHALSVALGTPTTE